MQHAAEELVDGNLELLDGVKTVVRHGGIFLPFSARALLIVNYAPAGFPAGKAGQRRLVVLV